MKIKAGDRVAVIATVISALDVSQSIDLEVEIDSGDGRKHVIDITDGQLLRDDLEPLVQRPYPPCDDACGPETHVASCSQNLYMNP